MRSQGRPPVPETARSSWQPYLLGVGVRLRGIMLRQPRCKPCRFGSADLPRQERFEGRSGHLGLRVLIRRCPMPVIRIRNKPGKGAYLGDGEAAPSGRAADPHRQDAPDDQERVRVRGVGTACHRLGPVRRNSRWIQPFRRGPRAFASDHAQYLPSPSPTSAPGATLLCREHRFCSFSKERGRPRGDALSFGHRWRRSPARLRPAAPAARVALHKWGGVALTTRPVASKEPAFDALGRLSPPSPDSGPFSTERNA